VTYGDGPGSRLLNVAEAAQRLGVSVSYLNKLRLTGGGPHFIKLGARRVVYDPSDLAAWVAQCRRTSTSSRSPGAAS
jgi:predicted DNA-binding transcriptional regulator AlpA